MDRETRDTLQMFVEDVCELLGIVVPSISFETSHFQTETMLAQCSSDMREIFVKDHERLNPDLLFAVAHELRHIWQLQTDEENFFSDYKTADECGGVDEYNEQVAEVDANAFAGMVMQDFFGLRAQYRGLSLELRQLIRKRMREIAREMRGKR